MQFVNMMQKCSLPLEVSLGTILPGRTKCALVPQVPVHRVNVLHLFLRVNKLPVTVLTRVLIPLQVILGMCIQHTLRREPLVTVHTKVQERLRVHIDFVQPEHIGSRESLIANGTEELELVLSVFKFVVVKSLFGRELLRAEGARERMR